MNVQNSADPNAAATPQTPNDGNTAPEGHSAPPVEGHAEQALQEPNNAPSTQEPQTTTENFYGGKYNSIDSFESAHKEAEQKIHSLSDENSKWQKSFQVFQPILDMVSKHPEWEQAIRQGLLPSQLEELPDNQRVEMQIRGAVESATKPLLEKIAQLENTNHSTVDTLETQRYKDSLSDGDKQLFNKYEDQIKEKRVQYKGMSLQESFNLVVPHDEREQIVKQRLQDENEKKRLASVGASTTPPGTGEEVLKKGMSVAESFALAQKMHKTNP